MTGNLDTLITRWGHAYLLGYARDRWIAIRRDGMLFIPADTLTQLEAEIGYDAGKNPAALDEDPASAAVGYLPARERDGTASTSDELPLVVQAAEAITAHLAQQYTILADLRDLLPGWHIDCSPEQAEWTARRQDINISHGSLPLFIRLTLACTEHDQGGDEEGDGQTGPGQN